MKAPEAIRIEAEALAVEDRAHHIKHGVDLNPFSTEGARDEWRRGFEGAPLLNYQGTPEFNRFYQRGAAAARIMNTEGGTTSPIRLEFIPKREFYGQLSAFISGIELGKGE